MKRGLIPDEELLVNVEVSMGYTTVAMGECLERLTNLDDKYEGLNLQVGYSFVWGLSTLRNIPDETMCWRLGEEVGRHGAGASGRPLGYPEVNVSGRDPGGESAVSPVVGFGEGGGEESLVGGTYRTRSDCGILALIL